MIPAQFMIDGKVEYGGAILDTYNDPDARGAGVKLMKRQIDESGICRGVAIPRLRELCARILKRDDINLRIIEKRYFFLDPTFVLSRKLPRLIARGLALAWKLQGACAAASSCDTPVKHNVVLAVLFRVI